MLWCRLIRHHLLKVHRFEVVLTALCVSTTVRCTTAANHQQHLNKFGTKNTYKASFLSSDESLPINADRSFDGNFDCRPVQVVSVHRHGIRYPGIDYAENAVALVTKMRSRGANVSYMNELEKIALRFLKSPSKALSPQGEQEQEAMGRRFRERYEKLFAKLSAEDVAFVSSSVARASNSCACFQRGFHYGSMQNMSTTMEMRNDLLRFFALCPNYMKSVRNNKTALREYHDFKHAMFGVLSERISRRLNVTELNISEDEITSLYVVAACEVAEYASSHWADLMDYEDLDVLEYSADLKNYWKCSYGYPINYDISCPLLSDIFRHMDNVISRKEYKKGVFYFGHAETVLPLAAALGLRHDEEPLTADSYPRQTDRLYRTSRIAPFSVNVGFVLYDCHPADSRDYHYGDDTCRAKEGCDDGGATGFSRFWLKMFYNEMPVRFPFSNRSLCRYEDVRKHYQHYIDSCNFNRTCEVH